MGCQGALNGLRVARALATASAAHRVLLCAVELCGLHLQYVDAPDLIVANSLFADGASAAVVGSAADGDGATARWAVAGHGSTLIPDSLDAMTWTIGDHGFTMTLSARVPTLIETNLRPWMESWLSTHGLRREDVGSWAIHPGGTRIITAVEKSLAIDAARSAASREVLANYGNMSSPTVLFVMQKLMSAAAPLPCVALAFGPGLSAEAALFT
jgi:predicted naringenin-chalcone synthase